MSGSDFHVRTDCRLCGGLLMPILDLGRTALANEYPESDAPQDTFPLRLAQCADCYHVQLPVVVRPERLFRNYAYVSGTNPMMRDHLATQAKELAVLARGGLVVEIASNDGTLLQEFKKFGLKVVGVDPAKNLAEEATQNGVPTVPEFLTVKVAYDLQRKHGRAGLVVANNVFAHVDNLTEFTASVKGLLSMDGTFVFEVGYFPDVVKGGFVDTIYHEHLSFHTLLPLASFFRRLNMWMYDAHRVDSQGGSIRVFVSKAKRQPSERLHKLWKEELLVEPRKLAEKVKATREALHKVMGYERWTGYGAPAKLTSLMAALDLTSANISSVMDDNPRKQGRYTPGTHLPIVAPKPGPDRLFLFSWNFADEIVPRLRQQGFTGPILVPLPEVRVL